MGIDIYKAIDELKEKRKCFCSEADFQLELAWVLKEQNPEYNVRLEYVPSFDKKTDVFKAMHIDIVLMKDGEFIPIELKYKTKGCEVDFDGEHYALTNQSAQDCGRYLYLKDIERIEHIRNKLDSFQEGYAIFITNDPNYLKCREGSCYTEFSLVNGTMIIGQKDWINKEGRKWIEKGYNAPIVLESPYVMNWKQYSSPQIKQKNANVFHILINKIEK